MKLPKIYAQQINKAVIDLSLSENPLGCSPLVIKALNQLSIRDISKYPSTEKLLNKISQKFKINPKNVILGNGSEQLIKLICLAFVKPKDLVIIQRGTFAVFTKECLLTGGKIKFFTPEELLRTRINPRVIFLCNPDNPTGEIIDNQTIVNIIVKNPSTIVIIDEANGEFINNSFLNESVVRQNCIVLKTFSKVLGLAGIRIGFAVGSVKLINKLSAIQQPFPVSSLACQLAIAALSDDAFVESTKKFIRTQRNFLTKALQKRKFLISKSVTNNLFIETPQANKLVQKLSSLGVSVVNGSFFPGMKRAGFRITIKDKRINLIFLKKFDQAISLLNKQKLLRSKE